MSAIRGGLHAMALCAVPLLSACGLAGSSTAAVPTRALAVFEGPVARAACGPGSNPEPGVQGRTRAVEDVASGRAALGYTCNLELVGQEGTRALWQMAWHDDCAYYGFGLGFGGQSGGVPVVDVSDSAKPRRTTTLTTPAMLDPWESLKANEKRGLLAAVGPGIGGPGAFDVYDVSGDCANPQLRSALPVDVIGHEGEWAPDGLTYYGSGAAFQPMTAIDLSNPLAPRPVAVLNGGATHGFSLSDDGNRLYSADTTPNGLEIWDVSAIQSRSVAAGAAVNPTVIGAVRWDDGSVAQMTIPVTIGGRPYLIFIDEGGLGMARIIDISDERNPVVISKLKNEINMPDAAEMRAADGASDGAFNYQGHYCSVPQRKEPGVVACSYFWQGVRVFDIRDPYHPKEIAYYVPSGTGNASSAIRFVNERGELWFTDQDHGFMVARFTNGVWPFRD